MDAKRSVVELVLKELQDKILQGYWPPGSSLPSERELAVQFSTSRTSIREALSALSAFGLVSVQAGRGVFVRTVEGRPEADKPNSWAFDGSLGLRDAYQIRYLIEPFAVGLLAPRISRETLGKLRSSVDAMRQELDRGGLVEAARKDFELHWVIAEQSGNQLFCDIISRCASMAPRRAANAGSTTADEHTKVVEAIASGSSQAAMEAMAEHILNAARRAGIAVPVPGRDEAAAINVTPLPTARRRAAGAPRRT